MSAISIRPLAFDDLDAVMEVECRSFITPWSREAFEAELTDNDLAYYLALIDSNRVVGYGGMWIIVDEAHVTNIAVLPEYRGRKLGRQLIEAMIELAKSKGAISMTLEVRTSNTIARNLYESVGFKGSGLRPHYYTDTKEDALIMWRDNLL